MSANSEDSFQARRKRALLDIRLAYGLVKPELQPVTGRFDQIAIAQGMRRRTCRLLIHAGLLRAFNMREDKALRTPGNDEKLFAGRAEGSHHAIKTNGFADGMPALAGQHLDATLREPDSGGAHDRHGNNGRSLRRRAVTGQGLNHHGALEFDISRHARAHVAQLVRTQLDDVAMLQNLPHQRRTVDQVPLLLCKSSTI